MLPVETIEHNGCTIKIYRDEDCDGPRKDQDNLGVMACFHRRYSLGDEGHGYKAEDYGGWDEMAAAIRENERAPIVLPLYLYDHSGLTIATKPFSCPWDSGQVGFVFASRKALLDCYGCKRLSKKTLAIALKVIQSEVEEYDKYLRGEVYGYVVEKDGEEDRSCWGFYSLEYAIKTAKEECACQPA